MTGRLLSDADILRARGPKNTVDPFRPYHFLVEPEYSADGAVEDVATVFLSNRECPFRCLMCDLWKNTTNDRVPPGAIPTQIELALASMPPARHLKLYNSGNFFDPQAIPPADLPQIAALSAGFRTVIVENHPKLCSDRVPRFQQLLETQLEVALGLETSHEPTLRQLNKQMTVQDFAQACRFLTDHAVRIRTFILLKPPYTSDDEGIDRAVESVRFAFDCGAECCAVIPVRAGNGIMDELQARQLFSPPKLSALETVLTETLAWKRGRVFADLWEARQFADCSHCADQRTKRLHIANLTQTMPAPVSCSFCQPDSVTHDA
ncbi:MAG: radical SAM protein [Fuerstiella sp.]